MIDNVLNNMPPKKEPYLEYFASECDEFHDMGAYEKSTDVNQIAAVYEKYRENPKTAYLGCSMGIIYRDNVELGENTVQEVMLDLRSGNIHSYISYLKDIVDEECDQSVRAGVLIERLKAYEPELPKDMEPMVYVNYCEESDLMNPRCQKLSELDAKTAEMDKEWYTKRDPKTDEPAKIAKIYVTVYYAEKGEQKLHHFKKSMDIGNGHGVL